MIDFKNFAVVGYLNWFNKLFHLLTITYIDTKECELSQLLDIPVAFHQRSAYNQKYDLYLNLITLRQKHVPHLVKDILPQLHTDLYAKSIKYRDFFDFVWPHTWVQISTNGILIGE